MHKVKILSNGPFPVGNRKKGMGSTISIGNREREPVGSDRSTVAGNVVKYGGKKFNGRKYEATRRSVFGTGVHK